MSATGIEGYMEKKLTRERTIKSIIEVKKLVKLIDYYGLNVIKVGIGGEYPTIKHYLAKRHNLGLNDNIIFELKDTQLQITTKYYENKPTTYHFNLNCEEQFSIKGLSCFTQFCRCIKIPKASTYHIDEIDEWFNEEKGNYSCSASPLIGFNAKYEGIEIQDVYEYDKNSAYASELIDKIPDLNKPLYRRDQKVKTGYVGFYIDDTLTLVEEGGYADITFPLIESPKPVKDYCMRWYNRKKEAKGNEKLEAKAMLNLPIGYCQRYNPFLRSYIVHKCNKRITEIIDSNTLFWNTDAIFSKKKRTDLPIGDEIGQFKEKHFKVVRYIGNSYQCDNEIPVWRGIPKQWFKRFEEEHGRSFNLLIDQVPKSNNRYEWDWDKLELNKKY